MDRKKNLLINLGIACAMTSLAWFIASTPLLYEQFTSARYHMSLFIRDDGFPIFASVIALLYIFFGVWRIVTGRGRLLTKSFLLAGILLGFYSVTSHFIIGGISSSGGSPKYVIFWCCAAFIASFLLPLCAPLWQMCGIESKPSKFLILTFCLIVPNVLLITSLSAIFAVLLILIPLIRPFV